MALRARVRSLFRARLSRLSSGSGAQATTGCSASDPAGREGQVSAPNAAAPTVPAPRGARGMCPLLGALGARGGGDGDRRQVAGRPPPATRDPRATRPLPGLARGFELGPLRSEAGQEVAAALAVPASRGGEEFPQLTRLATPGESSEV